jgi:hypothetical protein
MYRVNAKVSTQGFDTDVEISVVSDSAKEAVQRVYHLAKQLDCVGHWNRDVPEITDFGPVAVPEESPVPEYEIAPALRIATDSDTDPRFGAFELAAKSTSSQDLAKISRIIFEELSRRRGTQDGNALVP